MKPQAVLGIFWMIWVVSWFAASPWSARTAKKAGCAAERAFRLQMIAGGALLFAGSSLRARFNPHLLTEWNAGWAMLGLALGGLALTWWARLHLGKLWSANVQMKEGHKVIDTGPYAIVRHPIYTGVLAALLATALMMGTPLALAGFALMVWGFHSKARLEERFLSAELGAEAYAAYARRVPMLIPFWPA